MSGHNARQQGLVDGAIYSTDVGHSNYIYNGYSTQKRRHRHEKTWVPENTTIPITTGGTTKIKLNTISDLLGPLKLILKVPALSATGSSYLRFVDWAGLALWERIELRYHSQVVERLYPEHLFWRIKKYFTNEIRDVLAAELAGELTTTERNTAAGSEQTFIVELPFSFTKAHDRFLNHIATTSEPYIEIHWRKPAYFIQTDGTAPVVSISDLKLKGEAVDLELDERDYQLSVNATHDGAIKLFKEAITQEEDIPSGASGTVSIKLNNFETSLETFAFIIRPVSALESSTFANDPFGSMIDIDQWRITNANGDEVVDWTDSTFNRLYLHRRFFQSKHGDFIFFWTFSEHPCDELNAHGAYNFNALTNPTLEIKLKSALGSAHRVTIVGTTFNFLQEANGDITSQFK